MTTATAKKKPATKKATEQEERERRQAAMLARIEEAGRKLTELVRSVTQGEWIAITRALNMTRAEIARDQNLTRLALAWVKEKREHGAASWEVLLDLTDDQLRERHGFPTSAEVDEAFEGEDLLGDDEE